MTVKIGAIERRSRFSVRGDGGAYTGVELGADTAAALNLDEHLLATEAGPDAASFFAQLLYRHISVLMEEFGKALALPTPQRLVEVMFRPEAFTEFVRAAEGVPRDALNIAGLAAGHARANAISLSHVQTAARRYYLQDKEGGIAGNAGAEEIWRRLQRDVVANRRSRTFLVRRNRDHTHPAILDLYDARLIHLLRPGLETRGRPGVSFDGYAVDYGSYVNVLTQSELDSAWNARGLPWRAGEYSSEAAVLPDRFDEGVIFTPAKTRATRNS